METEIAIENLKKFDREWDLYDLPDRESCVRNLEVLLCQQVRVGEDNKRTIEALEYFRSVQCESLKPKLPDVQNELSSPIRLQLRHFRMHVADTTKDGLAVIGTFVILSALTGAFGQCPRVQNAQNNQPIPAAALQFNMQPNQ